MEAAVAIDSLSEHLAALSPIGGAAVDGLEMILAHVV